MVVNVLGLTEHKDGTRDGSLTPHNGSHFAVLRGARAQGDRYGPRIKVEGTVYRYSAAAAAATTAGIAAIGTDVAGAGPVELDASDIDAAPGTTATPRGLAVAVPPVCRNCPVDSNFSHSHDSHASTSVPCLKLAKAAS